MYLGVKFLFVLTPSPCGHSPYILLRKTQGGECDTRFVAAAVFSTPPSFGHLPYILLCKTPRNAAGHGREVGEKYRMLIE